ncbi:MAG: hypothetical protein WBO37_16755 [Gammaproteobacteria bacterium]
MKDKNTTATQVVMTDILNARNSLELMLLEYGNVHIETLHQLLSLTRTVEIEYSHICAHRLCQ